MAVQRPGDWNCVLCGNHNFANRAVCNKCQQPPAPGTVQVPFGGGNQMGGMGGMAGQGMKMNQMPTAKPGDWSCALCGNHNFANRTVCNKCQQPPAPGSVQVPLGGGNQMGGFAGNGMNQMKQMGGMNQMNQMGGFGMAKGGMNQMNQMNQMGGFGMAKGGKGKGGGVGDRAVPYGVAAHPGGSAKPGDWWCPSCSNHNYADKSACNRCGMPKPSAGQPLVQMEWPTEQQPMAQQMGMGNPMGMPKGGDWQCLECKHVNFANRDACIKCMIPKSNAISQTGLRPGDWMCTACQNHNYASKTACNKCQSPKTAESVSTANMRDGDWLCPSCGNHNYADKAACNRCKLPKM